MTGHPVLGDARAAHELEACEYCNAVALVWRKCKQICMQCGQINRSCADL